ncbi:DsrE family protein [Fusobacterium perfoetens]|uniref:DsrE family protein n=1 Tax=Fusobacterium perfoetens TaxID=852 RepID=UPI0015A33748|nr:DsrE family protein [Fusobacterium perfoetens]MCF2625196.1 DsrE family protein [Fusobacterium perfoetens]
MNKIVNILLHIDEEEKWAMTCKNAENLLKMGEIGNYTVNIEIVANGTAVKSLAAGSINILRVKEALEALSNKGVYIYCCSNSLTALSIDPSLVFSFVKTVPSGIFHIALRHNDGFAYIKP